MIVCARVCGNLKLVKHKLINVIWNMNFSPILRCNVKENLYENHYNQ